MRLFRRTQPPAPANTKATWRERRAAERTAQAEAKLIETEQRIHQIADEVREELTAAD